MSTLSKQKREEYKKLLKNTDNNIDDESLDEVIDYLFELAQWEVNGLKK